MVGEREEGGLRRKLKARVRSILLSRLRAHDWAGWAAREPLEDGPDVMQNWRVRPWQRKYATKLVTKRFLDGAARNHFLKRQRIAACPHPDCKGGIDEQEHWLLVCPGLEVQRKKGWKKVYREVGEWIKELTIREHHLLMAGLMPQEAKKIMRLKGKIRPGESAEQAVGRLQAAMTAFGADMIEARKERGDLNLGGDAWRRGDMNRCGRCGEDCNITEGSYVGRG